MDEITLEVLRDADSGMLVASWDAPAGFGGISTQAEDLRDLQAQIMDAVSLHFDGEETPQRVRLQAVIEEEEFLEVL